MELTWPCPVCGNSRIQPVLRKSLATNPNPLDDVTVLAYRCENGHLCLANGMSADEEPGSDPAA